MSEQNSDQSGVVEAFEGIGGFDSVIQRDSEGRYEDEGQALAIAEHTYQLEIEIARDARALEIREETLAKFEALGIDKRGIKPFHEPYSWDSSVKKWLFDRSVTPEMQILLDAKDQLNQLMEGLPFDQEADKAKLEGDDSAAEYWRKPLRVYDAYFFVVNHSNHTGHFGDPSVEGIERKQRRAEEIAEAVAVLHRFHPSPDYIEHVMGLDPETRLGYNDLLQVESAKFVAESGAKGHRQRAQDLETTEQYLERIEDPKSWYGVGLNLMENISWLISYQKDSHPELETMLRDFETNSDESHRTVADYRELYRAMREYVAFRLDQTAQDHARVLEDIVTGRAAEYEHPEPIA